MKETTERFIAEFFERHESLEPMETRIREAIAMWVGTYQQGHKLLLCGNGGSCADCDHIAGELLKGFLLKRPLSDQAKNTLYREHGELGARLANSLQQGLPAISLCGHSAAITAFANDVDGELVFAQQVLAYGKEGDTLVAISTSGNARNVNAAVITARALGLKTLGLAGKSGGELLKNCELCLVSPQQETFRIQEDHLAIYHLLCAATENELFEQ